MNTAKNLQLLDAQSNNISPATNIESLYYEINEGGVIYRNAIYKHFPVYVKYNNNIDAPITFTGNSSVGIKKANSTNSSTYSSAIYDKNVPSPSICNLLENRETPIYVSSIKQTRLGNTRYYKLDVSTYNLTDMFKEYAPTPWVQNMFDQHDISIHNIQYESPFVLQNISNSIVLLETIETQDNIGLMPKGRKLFNTNTSTYGLHGLRINDILDEIFYKRICPSLQNGELKLKSYTTPLDISSVSVINNINYDATIKNKLDILNLKVNQVINNADCDTSVGLCTYIKQLSSKDNKKLEIIIKNGNIGASLQEDNKTFYIDEFLNIEASLDISVGLLTSGLKTKLYDSRGTLIKSDVPDSYNSSIHHDTLLRSDITNMFNDVYINVIDDIYQDGYKWYLKCISSDKDFLINTINNKPLIIHRNIKIRIPIWVGFEQQNKIDWTKMYLNDNTQGILELTHNMSIPLIILVPPIYLGLAIPSLYAISVNTINGEEWMLSNNWYAYQYNTLKNLPNGITMDMINTNNSNTQDEYSPVIDDKDYKLYTSYKIEYDNVSGTRKIKIKFIKN